jgi:hypothetical protein
MPRLSLEGPPCAHQRRRVLGMVSAGAGKPSMIDGDGGRSAGIARYQPQSGEAGSLTTTLTTKGPNTGGQYARKRTD